MQDTSVRYTLLSSPIGELLLTADGEALSGVYMDPHQDGPRRDKHWQRDDAALKPIVEQLAAYFAGDLQDFDLPLVFRGTEFQCRVWEALRGIPFGETISYAELARRIEAPKAARPVGGAVGRNPISIIVPCHRVIGSSGQLTGFGGGLPRKQWLLEHERSVVQAARV